MSRPSSKPSATSGIEMASRPGCLPQPGCAKTFKVAAMVLLGNAGLPPRRGSCFEPVSEVEVCKMLTFYVVVAGSSPILQIFPCTLHPGFGQGNRCGFAAETLSRTSCWKTTDALGQANRVVAFAVNSGGVTPCFMSVQVSYIFTVQSGCMDQLQKVTCVASMLSKKTKKKPSRRRQHVPNFKVDHAQQLYAAVRIKNMQQMQQAQAKICPKRPSSFAVASSRFCHTDGKTCTWRHFCIPERNTGRNMVCSRRCGGRWIPR